MKNIKPRYWIAAAIAVLALGFFWGSMSRRDTVIPHPIHERSRLKTVARIARVALWFLAFADATPTDPTTVYVHRHDQDGEDTVNHYQGW